MPSLVVIGSQWGDEGKGKIVHVLAAKSDIVVRFQGGDNAGYSIFENGRRIVFHVLPSGILHPGVQCFLGGGMVLNLNRLAEEVRALPFSASETIERLRISHEANLVLPCHIAQDRSDEMRRGSKKLGTTQRGIGPAYADRAARLGVRMGDLLDEDYFKARLKICLDAKRPLLPAEDARETCDAVRVADELLSAARPFLRTIKDVGILLEEARVAGKQILFEGAQGTMLDLSSGTYPYVTSSHTTAGGVCVGAGVGPKAVDRVAGVIKAYVTRVGEGPLPTELNDEIGDAMRHIGGEYSIATGRARRCGWLDMVQLRHAKRVNGLDELMLTKLDVLDGFDRIGICKAYRCGGQVVEEWPCNPAALIEAIPEYEFLPGWKCSLAGARTFDELPAEVRAFVLAIERELEIPVTMISTGKERLRLIIRKYGR